MSDNKELQAAEKREVETTGELTQSGTFFTPAVDIYENDEALFLIADMPGVVNENVNLHLENDRLEIWGKVARSSHGHALYEEYRTGDYFRYFTLGNVIDQGKIQANMRDGVLRVILPKAEASKPRRIAIQAE